MSTRLISGAGDITGPVMIIASVSLIIATFINTDIGLIAILLSMLLSPELEAGRAAGHEVVIRAEDLLLIIVSLTWLAKMSLKKLPLLKENPLNVPIGIYLGVLCVATLKGALAGTVESPLKAMFFILKIAEYFILYFMVLNQTSGVKQVRLFLSIFLFTAFIVSIYGNVNIGHVSRISAPFEGRGEPNTLGGYMLFVLSMIGGIVYCYRDRRIILTLLFLFFVPTFLFTLSRASYLGMFASLLAFMVLTRDKKVIISSVVLLAFFILLVFAGPPVFRDRVLDTFRPEKYQELKQFGLVSLGPSPAARVVTYMEILTNYFMQRPMLGWGVTAGTFVDSQYFLVLKEAGLIGLCSFLWVMWRMWRMGLHSLRVVENPLFKGMALGYLVGFAGLMFHAIGSNTFIIIRISEPFWFFSAIIVKLSDIETGKAQMEEELMKYRGTGWRLEYEMETRAEKLEKGAR